MHEDASRRSSSSINSEPPNFTCSSNFLSIPNSGRRLMNSISNNSIDSQDIGQSLDPWCHLSPLSRSFDDCRRPRLPSYSQRINLIKTKSPEPRAKSKLSFLTRRKSMDPRLDRTNEFLRMVPVAPHVTKIPTSHHSFDGKITFEDNLLRRPTITIVSRSKSTNFHFENKKNYAKYLV